MSALVEPRLLDAAQLQVILGLTPGQFRYWKSQGKLPRHVIVLKRCHRWFVSEVEDWLEENGRPLQIAGNREIWDRLQRIT